MGSRWNTTGFLAVIVNCGNHDNPVQLWRSSRLHRGSVNHYGTWLSDSGEIAEVVAELLPDDMRAGLVHSSLQWESVVCVSVIGFLVGLCICSDLCIRLETDFTGKGNFELHKRWLLIQVKHQFLGMFSSVKKKYLNSRSYLEDSSLEKSLQKSRGCG